MASVFSGTRKWVYTQAIQGRYQRLHRATGFALIGFLAVVPFLRVGDHPAVQIDIAARRMYVLGRIFTAADGYLMVLAGLMAAFGLFFVTTLYGRVWCGYACPQTVFLEELVRPIERFVEGDRGLRMQRDAGPWTFDRTWRKAAKWTAFLVASIAVSMAFVAWFTGPIPLWTGQAGAVAYAFVGGFATIAMFDFAWFREQACNYVCPYARFQGALADDESQVVAYDFNRGEPRAKGKENARAGHCIDCDKCVAVCPQGIDIRNGYQLECITCGRCIDACASVMKPFGQTSLVHYSTVAELNGESPRLVRPRTIVYATLLTALAAGFVGLVALHQPLEVQVDRVPGDLFTIEPDGRIRDVWMVHIVNNDAHSPVQHFHVTVDGLPGADVQVQDVALGPTEDRRLPLIVRVPPSPDLQRTVPLTVRVAGEQAEVAVPATFKSPGPTAANGS